MKRIRNGKYAAASVAAATFLVYLAALRNGFVDWDDGVYVFNNLYIRSFNLTLFNWSFFHFYAGNWHPLTWISHAIDYALWGLNPFGHHLTSIILHAVNAFLVVVLVIRLLQVAKERTAETRAREFPDDRTILMCAGATGLLFGLHPVHVESVAWISERKDLLCAVFFLLSMIAYLNYADGADSKAHGAEGMGQGVEYRTAKTSATFVLFTDRRYLASLALFALALLSKPMAVTLPVVLLILDWYPLGRIRSMQGARAAIVEKFPFIAMSLFSSIVTIYAQRAGGSVSSTDLVPLDARVLVGAKAVIAYLANMVRPLELLPFYQYPDPKTVSFASFEYFSAVALVLGITAACLLTAKKQPLWLAAWSYYIATLIPVIGIIQVGPQAMADRYTYLPSLAPFLLVSISALKALTNRKTGFVGAAGGPGIAFIVLVALSVLTVKQIAIWKNTLTLWNSVIERSGEPVPLAYNCRGEIFRKRGQPDRAIADFDRAISLDPAYVEAYNNRGLAFDDKGRPERAIEDYDRAIALKPSFYKAYNNKGALYGREGVFSKAIEAFDKSIAINPEFADTYYNRAITYELAGQYSRALDDYSRAIHLAPNDNSMYFDRGKIYLRTGDRQRAYLDFQRACELGNYEACSAVRSPS